MLFQQTRIEGLWAITMERLRDDRGAFARTYCRREFAAQGLTVEFTQSSTSLNTEAGTLRGMHMQRAPHGECKLVRCLRGSIYDVVADLRPRSPTFLRWQAFELHQHGDLMLFIPEGCAHGFQTLRDDTEVTYDISTDHAPAFALGFRYDDPRVGITWPFAPTRIAGKDLAWPPLDPDSIMAGEAPM